MLLNENGNLGIGTSSPYSRLTVYGTNAEGWESGIRLMREDGGEGKIVVDASGMKFRYLFLTIAPNKAISKKSLIK